MNDIAVSCSGIEEPGWLDRLQPFCLKVLESLGVDGWEVSLLLCSDEIIGELNRRYRGNDAPTDVLSFSQENDSGITSPGDPPIFIAGDIVVSLDTLSANAEIFGVTEEEELKRLLVHGLLHLKGMDHEAGESDMISLQEEILKNYKEEKIF
jgi:probable rRNA maturation factor